MKEPIKLFTLWVNKDHRVATVIQTTDGVIFGRWLDDNKTFQCTVAEWFRTFRKRKTNLSKPRRR